MSDSDKSEKSHGTTDTDSEESSSTIVENATDYDSTDNSGDETNPSSEFISFQTIVNRLRNENITPDITMLESIVGGFLLESEFNNFSDKIPNTSEFYETLKATIQAMGLPNIVTIDETPDIYNNVISAIMASNNFIYVGQAQHESGEDVEGNLPEGEYPLDKWFKNPKTFAEFLIRNTDIAKNIVQSFASRYCDNRNVVDVLSHVFNKIPVTNVLRQDIDNDIITVAINQLGDEISRGSFLRNSDSLIDVMEYADNHIYVVDSNCNCDLCGDEIKPLIVLKGSVKEKIHASYGPYRCLHKFCRPCFYGLQASAQGDYCPSCRSVFKT